MLSESFPFQKSISTTVMYSKHKWYNGNHYWNMWEDEIQKIKQNLWIWYHTHSRTNLKKANQHADAEKKRFDFQNHNKCKRIILLVLTACCSVLQCVAVCYSVLHSVAESCSVSQCFPQCCRVMQCDAVCCSVLQCVAMCCSGHAVELIGGLCCSELQRETICCSVLQCVTMGAHLSS